MESGGSDGAVPTAGIENVIVSGGTVAGQNAGAVAGKVSAGSLNYIDAANLSNIGVSVTGTKYAGGVVGITRYAELSGCSNTGTVTCVSGYAAGISCDTERTSFKNCQNKGNVTGKYAAGIVSITFDSNVYPQYGASISKSYNYGTIHGTTTAGAIFAVNDSATDGFITGVKSGSESGSNENHGTATVDNGGKLFN